MTEFDINQIEKEARQEFEAEKRQGASGSGAGANGRVKKVIDQNGGAKLPMATKQQIMASVWNSILIGPAVDVLERQDGKIDIFNRSNKTKIQQGQYEYLPLAKRLYKKELLTVITQLYQAEDIDARIREALGQAMLAAVFGALNLLDNPPAHRELRLIRVAVQASLKLVPKGLADNYVLAFTQYNSTFASITIADVPFIILAMAINQAVKALVVLESVVQLEAQTEALVVFTSHTPVYL
ncbi:MAG: hypothetical protein EZS28_044443, partial [Streblomastix strix]